MQLVGNSLEEYAVLVDLAKMRLKCYPFLLLYICSSFLFHFSPVIHFSSQLLFGFSNPLCTSGKIFLPAANIRSQLLPFHGITIRFLYHCLKHMSLSCCFSLIIFCPSQQICHRDLKLENTLLDGSPTPQLKICDFGYSKVDNLRSNINIS